MKNSTSIMLLKKHSWPYNQMSRTISFIRVFFFSGQGDNRAEKIKVGIVESATHIKVTGPALSGGPERLCMT